MARRMDAWKQSGQAKEGMEANVNQENMQSQMTSNFIQRANKTGV